MDTGYDDDSLFYDDVNESLHKDIDFYRRLIPCGTSSILDIACGSGRITLPLVAKHRRIIGIDNSRSMLNLARSKASRLSMSVRNLDFICADMRYFNIRERFDFCICTYNAFQHLLTLNDQMSFFGRVQNHLSPRGLFAFDIMNPNFEYLDNRRNEVFKQAFVSSYLRRHIELFERSYYERATQINTITYVYRFGRGSDKGKEALAWTFRMRQFYPQELDALLQFLGFEIVQKYGSFDMKSFSGDDEQQIIVCANR